MESKIHRQFFLIAAVSIIATLLVSMGIFYRRFQDQVSYDLKTFGSVLRETQGWEKANEIANEEQIRVTLIDVDGSVSFDSAVDISKLQNHNDRPEVIEARKKGDSTTIRTSSTFSDTTIYYYAMALEDGRVLRVSREVNSFTSIFFDTLPLILGLSFLIMILAVVISRMLTHSIIEPIDELASNIDHMQDVKIYKELIPFVNTIQQQHENIIRQSKMRQDFTANVTHELKTPLTSISGYSELIETGMASDADIKHFAHEIHKSSARLLTTINDIIRLSELDSESSEFYEKVDLYKIAKDALPSLEVSAKKYQVSLYLHGQSEMVHASEERMIELIYNLVDNAIRYNKPNGRVDVRVDHDEAGIFLSVKDNGIGIPKRYHERIFERFYRVDKSRSKATGGTGLGLAIVKHIVLNHHAVLTIESEEGKGTEIQIRFDQN